MGCDDGEKEKEQQTETPSFISGLLLEKESVCLAALKIRRGGKEKILTLIFTSSSGKCWANKQ